MVQFHPPAKGIHLREKVAEDHDADHSLGSCPAVVEPSFIRINRVGPGLMRERGHLGGRSFTSNGDRRGEPGKPYRQISEPAVLKFFELDSTSWHEHLTPSFALSRRKQGFESPRERQ